MVTWGRWAKFDEKGLARYVLDSTSNQVRIRPEDGRSAAELYVAGDYLGLVRELYESLSRMDIRWSTAAYHPERESQIIRTPETILSGSGDGTCLDLALLFAGAAMGQSLLPIVVVLHGHALVAVSLTTPRKDSNSSMRGQSIEDGGEGDWWDGSGVLTNPDTLKQLVDGGRYVVVECTGFSRSRTAISDGYPEGRGRIDGLLPWDRAVSAGREQLDQTSRPFRFAIDPVYLQDILKIGPFEPTAPGAELSQDPLLRMNFELLIDDNDYSIFVGRGNDLRNIDAFLNGPPGLLAITAPAGLGKTSLCAQLVRLNPDRFAYHFFTARYDNGIWLDESFFLRNMLQQLDPHGGARENLNLPSLRASLRQVLSASSPADAAGPAPRTILLDALDEVAGWSPAGYLSGWLLRQGHAIISLRDTGQNWLNQYRLPKNKVTELALGGFDRETVSAVFTASGPHAADLVNRSGVLDLIMDKAAYTKPGIGSGDVSVLRSADPLYIRFLAEDANNPGATVKDLAAQPSGLAGYLDRWWEELCSASGDVVPLSLFAVLTASFGPLSKEDLKHALPEVNDPLGQTADWLERKLLPLIRRLVTGNDSTGYSLTHPRLRQHFTQKFSSDTLNDARQRLLTYCANWSQSDSVYPLTNFPYHLAELEPGALPRLYRDYDYLERTIRTLGIDRVTGTLDALVLSAALDEAARSQLSVTLRILELEAHHLRAPFPIDVGGYSSRQMQIQALTLGDERTATRVHDHLNKSSLGQLIPIWSAGANSPALRRTFEGHAARVSALCMTPDGALALSASWDGTARLWDLASGKCVRTLVGHDGRIMSAAMTANGSYALTGGWDHTARYWNLETGAELDVISAHTEPVTALALSYDGTRAVTTSWEGTALAWSTSDTSTLRRLVGHTGSITAVALSRNGKFAITGGEDTTARIWSIDSGSELCVLRGHAGPIRAVAFNLNGTRVLTGGDDATARFWDVATATEICDLRGHMLPIRTLAFSADGTHCLTGSDDATARYWELRDGTCIHELGGHKGHVNQVVLIRSDSNALTASMDGTIRVWDVNSGQEIQAIDGHKEAITALTVNAAGTQCVTASADRTLRHWDVPLVALTHTQRGHTEGIASVAASSNGSTFVTMSKDGPARVWNLESGEEISLLVGPAGRDSKVVVSSDGGSAITTGAGGAARYWDLRTGKLVHLLSTRNGITSAALTRDATRAVTTSRDGSSCHWDLRDGREIQTLAGHRGVVRSAAITLDGTRAVTTSSDASVCHWDLDSGELLHTLNGHTDSVNEVLINADGTRAVTAGSDGTARLWNLITGKQHRCLRGLTGGKTTKVTCIAITDDGKFALTGGADGAARLWEQSSGTELHTLRGHRGPVTAVGIFEEGSRGFTAGYDSTIRVWDLAQGRQEHQATLGSIVTCGVLTRVGASNAIILGEASGRVTVLKVP